MNLRLEELLEIDRIEQLLITVKDAFNIPSAIVDDQNKVIIDAGWMDIYEKYHLQGQNDSDIVINTRRQSYIDSSSHMESYIYEYESGIVDCSIPIAIEGRILGHLLIGQFMYEEANDTYIVREAERFGFDVEIFLENMRKLQVVTKTQLNKYLAFMKYTVETIADMGLVKLRMNQLNNGMELARDQAIKANESKSIFFARMSHEIRTPMNAIIGLSNILEKSSLNSTQKSYVQI